MATASPKQLSTQQVAFVSAYLGDARRNATKAALLAGYSEKTAYSQGTRLLKNVEIQAAIQAWRDEAKQAAITDISHRLNVLDSLESKLLAVIDARINAYKGTNVIGGETGLVVRQYKVIGSGDAAEVVEEYTVDTATIRELRAVHEQAAKELGQWTDKLDITGTFLDALRDFGRGDDRA